MRDDPTYIEELKDIIKKADKSIGEKSPKAGNSHSKPVKEKLIKPNSLLNKTSLGSLNQKIHSDKTLQ
jgi:hypothetical protein